MPVLKKKKRASTCTVPGSSIPYVCVYTLVKSVSFTCCKKFSSIFEVGVASGKQIAKVGLIFFDLFWSFLCLKMLSLVYFYKYNYKPDFLSLIFDSRAID